MTPYHFKFLSPGVYLNGFVRETNLLLSNGVMKYRIKHKRELT